MADFIRYEGEALRSFILPVSHDMLVDYTDHVCTDECPPVWTPPPVPFWLRVRRAIRRAVWTVTGLRVVHKSRIRSDDDRWE